MRKAPLSVTPNSGAKRYRGTFEPENNGPIITAEFVDARDYDRLRGALKDLIRAYVNTLESGRDRIISLGGDCDPLDVMERGDPYLNRAKEAIRG